MSKMKSHKIKAVTLNHNTSAYMELMLRSLFTHHPKGLNMSLTVLDNASTDDMSALIAYTRSKGLLIEQTGYITDTENNSH